MGPPEDGGGDAVDAIAVERRRLPGYAGVVGVDAEGVIRHVSADLDGRYGFSIDDVMGRSFVEVIDEADTGQAVESFSSVVTRPGHHQSLEIRLTTPDGEVIEVDVVAENCLDALGLVVLNLGDRQDRRRSVQLLDLQAQVVRQIALGGSLDVAVDAVLRFVEHALPGFRAAAYFLDDLVDGRATTSPSISVELSRRLADAIRDDPSVPGAMAIAENETIIAGDLTEPAWAGIAGVVAAHAASIWSVPIRYERGARCLGCIEIYGPHAAHPRDEDWTILELVSRQAAVAHDRVQMQRQLLRDAEIDPLTGTPNRRVIRKRLGSLLEAGSTGHVVCFIDLDRLKVVNDGLGHEAGDLVIREAARRLRDRIDGVGTVGRFGGDEFVAISHGPDVPHQELARRCLDAFAEPVDVGGRRWRLTASIGVVVIDGQQTSNEVLRDADAAMYEAKRGGRGRWQLFDATTRASVVRRMSLEHELAAAVQRGEIGAAFQPVVATGTWELRGIELLARWHSPTRGAVGPNEFIPLVEELGLIDELGAQMIDRALTLVGELQRLDRVLCHVSVNVSPLQLQSSTLIDHLVDVRRRGGPLGWLCVEMTEQHMIDDTDQTLEQLQRLIGVGVGLAVDDFGTGYSSLGALHRLPARTLKLDRRLVQQIGAPAGDAVVAAVIGVARAYGMSTVAEGVETVGQARRLTELGVDGLQGFLFAHPEPMGSVLHRLREPGWPWDVPAEHLGVATPDTTL